MNAFSRRLFWMETGERALKTSAQAAILALGAEGLTDLNLFHADFAAVGGFAAGGFALSLLTSIASAQIGPNDSPSLV